MAFSMHSHSGQFCPGHAKDSLEDVIKRAIELNMSLLALTEHMPRTEKKDLYPEEVEAQDTIASLFDRHPQFLTEATRLRTAYASQITILVGFEGEWIRPSYGPLMLELAQDPRVDYFVGSVHHVHEIPIDFDRTFYLKAREVAGGTDEALFREYFESQWEMLNQTRPLVVGHFDLIRLFSDEPDRDLMGIEGVRELMVRNLKAVVEIGGLLEVNTSALRKGMREPYPGRSIIEEYLKMGGKLTLSDDSHGVAQVGLNFKRAVQYLRELGVEQVYYPFWPTTDSGRGSRQLKSHSLADLKLGLFPQTPVK